MVPAECNLGTERTYTTRSRDFHVGVNVRAAPQLEVSSLALRGKSEIARRFDLDGEGWCCICINEEKGGEIDGPACHGNLVLGSNLKWGSGGSVVLKYDSKVH